MTAPLQSIDLDGTPVGRIPRVAPEDLRALFRHMLKLRTLDGRMLSLQRQGRIGFYGTATGEEAAVVGSGYPLRPTDWVFPALRQIGVSVWRGTSVKEIVCQLMGNSGDVLIGRQMPCHFSDRKVNSVAWSSVIATQLPHAMGAAWAAKLQRHDTVMMGYLGDGATSTGDFHAAANFAGVFRLPVVFFIQNNQWAISVPLSGQTASETLAMKSQAYGFPGVRVDGNDVLAVIAATRDAVDHARAGQGPTLIEAVTFRMGGHSSSDDASRYRDVGLVADWERRDPIARFRAYLRGAKLVGEADETAWVQEINDEISAAILEAEALPPPPIESLFADVYAKMPRHLQEQMRHAVAMGEGTRFEGTFPI
jgi:pyruvate dehydrogenase E1 component alpha subunit/2-oxoisovalerate dehydrogenase E1 component alpha subunit